MVWGIENHVFFCNDLQFVLQLFNLTIPPHHIEICVAGLGFSLMFELKNEWKLSSILNIIMSVPHTCANDPVCDLLIIESNNVLLLTTTWMPMKTSSSY